ncbi:T9SS type A sorting domain-containing protein [Chryseobacterium sp. Tr-659]|uniref:T9SS type A sorting domain-containing protein n=1 Tax=Chryseobacterium sp. Tr-659 TaxID=2608340 RepID=UPI00141DF243|nr:T9SS type A sorting domain-containing protein [Chryseobacterium sp. Tr-659]NIF06726.1 T9SS type A sorting domain-containing protein [Chryseobacterium sp. Tr-659]
MRISKIASIILFLNLLNNGDLSGQNLQATAHLLETNFSADSKPSQMNFITPDRLIFNAKFGVTIKGSGNENSRLLIKVSSAYKNYVNEDNTYTYAAAKALYISVIDNNAYFFIKKSTQLSLWKTDGTDAGTKMIKEFPNTSFSSSDFIINSFNKVNGKLIFDIYHQSGSPSRNELWISDETPGGTVLANTINNNFNSGTNNYVNVNNTLYFINYNSASQKKLWKSDGTITNTSLVFNGIQDDFTIEGKMVGFNGLLYFIKKKNNILSLSYYDSNNNSIVDVLNLPGTVSGNEDLFLQNNSLVFFNNNSLWKSDGTTLGTHVVASNSYPNLQNINSIYHFKNKIYFNCYLGSNVYTKLFYDGNTLAKLTDIFPELENGYIEKKSNSNFGESNYLIFKMYSNNNLMAFNGISLKPIQNLIFAYDSGFEMEIADTSDSNFIINAGNKKYGQEIFKFNFNNGLSDLYDNANSSTGSSFLSPQEFNNQLFYFGTDEYGLGPMLSNGTPNGTFRIKSDVNVPSYNWPVSEHVPNIQLNNKMYFPCSIGGLPVALCVSDGTSAGTTMLKNVNPMGKDGSNSYDYPAFIKVGNTNKFLFKVNENNFSAKLWVSDGTESGTFNLNALPSFQNKYAVLNDKTYYTAFDYSLNKRVLMFTDGTQNGTQVFYNFDGNKSFYSILGYADNKFFFLVNNQIDYWTSKTELWVSDGSAIGTFMLKSFSNPHYSNPGFNSNVEVKDGKLYFFACAENAGNLTLHAPYVSDGTINGTYKISNNEFDNGAYPVASYSGSFITHCDNKVYYMNAPNYNGYNSMWVYDNGQFNNVYTSPSLSNSTFIPNNFIPYHNVCINGNLFFLNKEYSENEIWVTNGYGGVNPLYIQSNNIAVTNKIINSISKVNNKIFLNAPFNDSNNFNFYGNELYVMDVGQITLGINETIGSVKDGKDLSVIVYPNPAVSEVNLISTKGNNIEDIEVYNMSGLLILNKRQANASKVALDLNNFASGVYLLKIKTEKGMVMKKIIKK